MEGKFSPITVHLGDDAVIALNNPDRQALCLAQVKLTGNCIEYRKLGR
jgi:hypothetical protein